MVNLPKNSKDYSYIGPPTNDSSEPSWMTMLVFLLIIVGIGIWFFYAKETDSPSEEKPTLVPQQLEKLSEKQMNANKQISEETKSDIQRSVE